MSIIEQAIEYAEKGFSIIRLREREKKPMAEWKQWQWQRPNPKQVEIWFKKTPNANIGIVTGTISGVAVVDTDTEAAEQYALSQGLPTTPTVQTGKGRHRYYRYPEGLTNKAALHGISGLDIRGEGGYVVAPPSIHPSGTIYQWEVSLDTPFAPCPDWIWKEKIADKSKRTTSREEKYIKKAIKEKLLDACQRVSQAQNGSKHTVLRDAAILLGGYLHYGVVSQQQVVESLYNALPPTVLDFKNAEATIRDGIAYGIAHPLTIETPNHAPTQQNTTFIIINGNKMLLPPGYRYNGTLQRGEKYIYMGKLWVEETGTNVHSGENTAVVAWSSENDSGKTVILREEIASKAGCTKKLGGAGAAIHAFNAGDVSRYLVEFLQWNRKGIPNRKHSEYYGNFEDGMLLPAGGIGCSTRYIGKEIVVGQDPNAYSEILHAVKDWAPPIFWAVLAFSLASPFYERIKCDRNPILHLGGSSGSGKTTIAHFATGCFGDPRVIPLQVQCGSSTTTPKGLATAILQANGLPIFLDDIHKMLERKKQETEGIIYDFANGQNRVWGTPQNRNTAGGQEIRGTLLTAGETSLNFMNAGSNNRVFSFDCGTQQPLGVPARSSEGMARSRQLQTAWKGGAGLFGKMVCEKVLEDWQQFLSYVRAFELERELEPLQAWRKLLAIAAATLQTADLTINLDLDMDWLLRQWSAILQQNNKSNDPAEEAFDRVRILLIQSEYSHDGMGGGIPTWHSLHYEKKLIAMRREGQTYWRCFHTSHEWKRVVGENAVEMFAGDWLSRGWIIPHKNGGIVSTAWVGRGSPRCLLVKDFLSSQKD